MKKTKYKEKKSITINIRLSKYDFNLLDRKSEKMGMNHTECIRSLLHESRVHKDSGAVSRLSKSKTLIQEIINRIERYIPREDTKTERMVDELWKI